MAGQEVPMQARDGGVGSGLGRATRGRQGRDRFGGSAV